MSERTEAIDTGGEKGRFRLLVAGLVLVALLLLIGVWVAARPAPDQLQGMVDADEVNVATKALARVDRLLAEEGATVTAGTVLAVLSSPEIDAGRQQAQGVLAGAEAMRDLADNGARKEDVESLRAVWQAAKAGADLAAVTARRADNLYAEGVIAAQRRDEAHAARDASARQADAARLQYLKAQSGARAEEKAAARAQVQVARAGVSIADALGAEKTLLAPIGGEVTRRLAEPGEIVGPAVPVFQIIDTAHPWVSLNLREDQFNALQKGQVVTGRVPALGDQKVRFKVTYISPQGDFATWRATRQSSGFDVRSFEIRLHPSEPVKGLRPGMSVLFDWPQ
ncbi:MAG: hemolysin secretion protein D [Novosphingobium pentaromativorans]|uniref:Hemolysin secretion protein D n=1 Tax=Novosphingobium pentaromativorans TaxID=205844 RepID=A0A2W5NRD6_9SPHN|nr:efflux RND transporter periplasmic adaptor subunit [Novosphingobium panipatense]PZQ54988.1 MAG: hemolysin secretion protein D [Novosphingobium pentaromativorans]